MKKFIALLLGAILCFSLMACEGTGESSASSTTNSTVGEQEESPLEKQYQEIKEYLNDLSVVYDYESEQGLTGQDALHFAYTWFNEHSDYKDCADYLVNFTVVDDALTKITKQATDAFGQVQESVYTTYIYDENGKCFELSDLHKTFNLLNVFGITEGQIKECRYDDTGKLVEVDLYGNSYGIQQNNGFIETKITIIYDENGNMVKADFLKSNGTTWSNTYTYNELNQLTMARYDNYIVYNTVQPNFPKSYACTYLYDEQGNLIKLMKNEIGAGQLLLSSFSSAEYTYNQSGQIQEVKQYNNYWYSFHYKEIYTYDSEGRISYIEGIDLRTNLPYKLTYHYEDMIIYKNN